MLRDQLVAEYQAYRDNFNQAPNLLLSPNPREEAGYCLQFPGPMQIFDNLAHRTSEGIFGYWAHVRSWIVAARAAEGGAA